MKYFTLVGLIVLFISMWAINSNAHAQIKWEATFDTTALPLDWLVIDKDGSGTGIEYTQAETTPSGVMIKPQAGQSFWSSNVQNANLAGVIDEWLISPQISVIFEGDSLYFWAGAVGGPFDDSLRVLVSTTDNQLSSFSDTLGYFKVDGPVGSWHKYGFDLSAFDNLDIYFAINYHIQDGGPGGQHSDFVWIDHFIITGDPATINNRPTKFPLLAPENGAVLSSNSIRFKWNASTDSDSMDTLRYELKILDKFPNIVLSGILDTVLVFYWPNDLLTDETYRWTVNVTDGKSNVASPDTFLFKTPTTVGVNDHLDQIPQHLVLEQNYPNPFNAETTIKFALSQQSKVTLKLFDILGREVAPLVDEELHAGEHNVVFDAQHLTSGIYFYHIRAGEFSRIRKLAILK